MSRFAYIASNGDRYKLDGDLRYSGIAADIRSAAWSYTLGGKRVTGLVRNARTVDVTVRSLTVQAAEAFRRAADGDTVNNTPGTFEADGWTQSCYIVAAKMEDVYSPSDYLAATFTAVLLDGCWRKAYTKSFVHEAAVVNTDLDYAYDYPHDLGIGTIPDEVDVEAIGGAPVSFVIYGAAVNPYITIGSNRYEVDVTVPAGGYLVVDGLKHTITLVDQNGNRTNSFDAGLRGTGAGSGTYIFETLKPGINSVTWPSGFGFDLTYYDEEAVPPWIR